jgi:TetR/AcrR family transcriptional repressor of nem operon
MPYTVEHKRQTRARIIESARVLFNRAGFDQVSIDDIMSHAGLTRGGFYNPFSDKAALYAEAVRSYADCNPFVRETAQLVRPLAPRRAARRLVELYLSDDVDQHCPLIALPSDVARAGLEPRAAYAFIVRGMLAVFLGAFGDHDAAANAKARVILNLCVGELERLIRESRHTRGGAQQKA